jgi:Galactosyltransferase
MHERLFVVVCNAAYYPGLQALLNSIFAYHGQEIPIHIYGPDLDAEQLSWIDAHPAPSQVWRLSELPIHVLGLWEAKQQVFSHSLGMARCVYLLDADLVLTSRVDDVFDLAEEGLIVSSSDGAGIAYGQNYAVYGPKLPGLHHPYLNSGALCLDIIRHWDLVGLWAFASKYGAYSPGGGAPLSLPGHGDQGTFNAVAAHLGKVEHFHILPEGPWCDCTKGCTVRIRARGSDGQLDVWNETEGAVQRLVHSSGPKWWTEDGARHLARFGDKLECFRHFTSKRSDYSPLLPRVEPIGTFRERGGPRILIGICSCGRYGERREAIRQTWLRTLPAGVTALFFIGRESASDRDGLISLAVPDDYQNLTQKVHGFFRYALAHYDFDYLFKCDDDTYVHGVRLLNEIRPGVGLLGSMQLRSAGYASGGAGYLLSREMVEKLAVDLPPNPGAEDVFFSSRSASTGLRLESTPAFQGFGDQSPEVANAFATGHWCGPFEMRRIHGALTGEHPGAPLITLKAKHRAWSGKIRLYGDGQFWGGAARPNGKWSIVDNGNALSLQWHHWAADYAKRTPSGFETPDLRLEFRDTNGSERWSHLATSPLTRSLRNPRVVAHYQGRTGNRLFIFAAAWALAEAAGVPLSAQPIEGFPGTDNFSHFDAASRPLRTTSHSWQKIDWKNCLDHIAGGGDVIVNGYHQRYELIRPFKQRLRTLLRTIAAPEPMEYPSTSDLVVNVRLGDYFSPHISRVFAYPLDSVADVIREQTFSRLFVTTDEPDHPFIEKLVNDFGAKRVPGNALAHLKFLTFATRLVITPSTFGWWAAWLGRAKQIWFPLAKGPWKSYPDIQLWVDDEKRYIAY